MSSMRDVVADRLNRMEDLEQRRALKQIVSGLFTNLVDYQEQMNRELEQRVFEEVRQEDDKFDVYVTVCPREELDPVHHYLFPMVQDDIRKKSFDMIAIADDLSRGRAVTLTTLFLECRHELLRSLWTRSDRIFQGEIKTSLTSHKIEVQLRPNRTYIREIEKLYHIFRVNHLPWRTVNHPYAAKFFDVILAGEGCQLSPEEEIVEITVHLEEFEAYKRSDMVPLWNIEPLYLKTVGFPSPAWDKVNYEHVFSIRKRGAEHGYLVDAEPEHIRYIKYGTHELTVVSPKDRAEVWRLLKVVRPSSLEDRPAAAAYEMVSNRRNGGFTDAYIRHQSPIVRTKGEVLRIVSLLEDSRLQLMDIRVADASDEPAVTYDMNPFIDDRIRVKAGRARLRLTFRYLGTEPPSFIMDDVMSFLVSEVQLYFPEYRCEGEWA